MRHTLPLSVPGRARWRHGWRWIWYGCAALAVLGVVVGAATASSGGDAPLITFGGPETGATLSTPTPIGVSVVGSGLTGLTVEVETPGSDGSSVSLASTETLPCARIDLVFVLDPGRLSEGPHRVRATALQANATRTEAYHDIVIDLNAPRVAALSASPTAGVYAGMSPKRFTFSVVATDSISSSIDYAVVVRSPKAAVVRRLTFAGSGGTTSTFTWDIRDSSGRVLPPGLYELSVSAQDGVGHLSKVKTVRVRILSLRDVARRVSGARAKSHAKAVAGFGIRRAGGVAERRAADYVATKFKLYGYQRVLRKQVKLRNGKTSQNVIAVKPGSSATAPIVIVGAHIDSRADKRSPGGNDNASGVGVMLEVARAMQAVPTSSEIWFVGFGAEEIYDGNPDHHHEGSRALANGLTRDQMGRGVKMVNLDMVGVGSRMRIGTQSGAPRAYARYHLATGPLIGYAPKFATHGAGSDHERFVSRGIPVAYYDWVTDPRYHTPADTAQRLQEGALQATGRTLFATLIRQSAR